MQIDFESLSNLFVPETSLAEYGTLTASEARILTDAADGVAKLTSQHADGLLLAREAAAKFGAELSAYGNVSTTPIVPKNVLPRGIQVMKVPTPKRVGEPPLYDDIHYLSQLYTRDVILQQIELAENVASVLGKPFDALTIADFPCDYFYDGFFETPSASGGDPHEANVKELFSKVVVPSNCNVAVTMCAEGSKAFSRYYRMGFTEIHVVYPSDMYVKRLNDNHIKWTKERYPDVDIHVYVVDSSDVISDMDSEIFRTQYDLPSNACFLTNFLPQFYHLADQFAGVMCIHLDYECVADCQIAMFPDIKGDYAFKMDYYSHWIQDTYPDIALAGHGGIFDPLRKAKLSYSVHGTFIDYIYDESDFRSTHSSTTKLVSTYTGVSINSKLKVRVNDVWEDHFEFSLEDQDVDYDERSVPSVSPTVLSDLAMSDVSMFPNLGSVLFMPMVKTHDIVVNDGGYLELHGQKYMGFPPGTTVAVTFLDEGGFRVVDVNWSRRDFFRRRISIPAVHRLEYSKFPQWENCYVVYPDSYSQYNMFGLCRSANLLALRSMLTGENVTVQFPEYEFFGLAWNGGLHQFVEDRELYSYVGSIDFKYDNPNARRLEFSSSASLKRSLKVNMGGAHFIVPESKSVDVIEFSNVQSMLRDSLPSEMYGPLCLGLLPHTSSHSKSQDDVRSMSFFDINAFSLDKKILYVSDLFKSPNYKGDVWFYDGEKFQECSYSRCVPMITGSIVVEADDEQDYVVLAVYISN